MRLHRVGMTNFRGFAKREIAFHPEFNLIIGENGAGKTSVLEALSVALAVGYKASRGLIAGTLENVTFDGWSRS